MKTFLKQFESCSDLHYRDKVRILRDFGADLIELKCPVFDWVTSDLLSKAGAVIMDHQLQVNFF